MKFLIRLKNWNFALALCATWLLLSSSMAHAQIQRAFGTRYGANVRGDIVLTGNTVVRPQSTTATRNGAIASRYTDVDNSNTTTNSASAQIKLPAGVTGRDVLFARLYWSGRINSTTAPASQSIRFSSTGLAGNYVDYTAISGRPSAAESQLTNFTPTGFESTRAYAAWADITAQIQGTTTPTTLLAGNISSDLISDALGAYGGWSVVMVYRQSSEIVRQLRVFDGLALISNGNPQTIALSGFRTPDAGNFTLRFGSIAYEGDLGIAGDQLLFNNVALSDGAHSSNDFFNASISQAGVKFDTELNERPQLETVFGMDTGRTPLDGPSTTIGAAATTASLTFTSSQDTYFPAAFTTSIPSFEIAGRVFVDQNFGGGAGRAFESAAGATGAVGARVELYNATTNAFIKATTTDSTGTYYFYSLGSGNFKVRVVNSTVVSNRAGSTTDLLPVQTYRTDASGNLDAFSSGTATPVVNRVGGENPAVADPAASTLLLPANSQSVSTVVVGDGPVAGVDFGFNFDTVVNTNDAGQGSLRQFVLNANALSNTGLDQAANALFDPAAGVETSIFQIPASDTNFQNGVARITLASGLAITGANAAATSIDGRTQTANIGDTNAGTFGSGGTVGVGNIALPTIPKPEIEITGPNSIAVGLDVQAASAIVRNASLWGFGANGDSNTNATIRVGLSTAFTAPTLTQLLLGASAVSATATPVAPTTYGKGDLIRVIGIAGGSVTNSLIGFGGGKGIDLGGANGWTIQANEIRNNARDAANWDGIDARGSGTQILENLVYNHGGNGLDSFNSAGSAVVRNNTSRNNGLLNTPTTGESPGIRVYGTGNTITLNIFRDNYGAGILMAPSATALISQNSISGNGDVASNASTTPSRQIGIDLLSAADAIERGTSPFVTPNDSGDGDSGGNGLLNFPVITAQTVSGGNLTLEGFAPAGATVEVFVAAPDPSGFGEGQTYSFNFAEGSAADTDTTTGDYNAASLQAFGYPASVAALTGSETGARRFRVTVPANGLTSTSALTATATVAGQTSEFSPVTVTFVAPPTNTVSGTVYLDANRNSTLDAQEGGTGLGGLFVKAVLSGQTNAAQAVAVDAATGDYSFSNLAAGNYTLVLDNNATLSDTTPAIPAGYVGTQAPDGTRTVTVGAQTIQNQNFGLFNGAQISGVVFEDTGNGTGPGLPNVKVNLTRNDGTIVDTTTTDASGNFSFRVPNSLASTPLRVVEVNPDNYRSASGNAGNTGGAYDLPTDTISFNYAAGSTYSGLRFGDARGISFTGEDAKTGTIGSSVFYPHVFTAQTAGSVTFNTTQVTSPNNAAWTVVQFRDSNGNGTLDGGDAQITGPVAVTAGTPITIFLQNFIPTTASNGAQDKLTVTATFTPANGPVQSLSRSDLTTVAASQGFVLTKTVDRNTAQSNDVLLYTITYRNTGADALTNLVVRDATPAYTRFVAAADGTRAAGLTSVAIANPGAGNKGTVSWTFAGSLNPGESGTVTFRVRVE